METSWQITEVKNSSRLLLIQTQRRTMIYSSNKGRKSHGRYLINYKLNITTESNQSQIKSKSNWYYRNIKWIFLYILIHVCTHIREVDLLLYLNKLKSPTQFLHLFLWMYSVKNYTVVTCLRCRKPCIFSSVISLLCRRQKKSKTKYQRI